MKRFLGLVKIPMMGLLAMVCYFSCSDPEADEPSRQNNNDEEVTPEEADKLLLSFKFSNSHQVTGKMPTVTNSSLVKTGRDTIYTMPGLKTPIRLSHPSTVNIKGWYVAVGSSTIYIDVPVEDESDTVSVVIFQVDTPEEITSSYEIPLLITPYDENNAPVDIIDRPLIVELPTDSKCDILTDGDTTNITKFEWFWDGTLVFDETDSLKVLTVPLFDYTATQTPGGCCIEEPYCPSLVFNQDKNMWEYVVDSEVTAVTSYKIHRELFTFFKNGTFARYTSEHIKNFDAENTDWCAHIPAYNDRKVYVNYYGTHNYAPGNTSILYQTKRTDCDGGFGNCGYASRPGDLQNTCHMMVITVDKTKIEGSREVRLYVRSPESDIWKD